MELEFSRLPSSYFNFFFSNILDTILSLHNIFGEMDAFLVVQHLDRTNCVQNTSWNIFVCSKNLRVPKHNEHWPRDSSVAHLLIGIFKHLYNFFKIFIIILFYLKLNFALNDIAASCSLILLTYILYFMYKLVHFSIWVVQ